MFQYFKLTIGSDYDLNKDLVIKVMPEGDYGADPDVYISKVNEYPSGRDSAEWVCASYGKDTCSINHNHIRGQEDTFYMGVTCK